MITAHRNILIVHCLCHAQETMKANTNDGILLAAESSLWLISESDARHGGHIRGVCPKCQNMRGGAVVARQAHNLEVAGATPALANTNTRPPTPTPELMDPAVGSDIHGGWPLNGRAALSGSLPGTPSPSNHTGDGPHAGNGEAASILDHATHESHEAKADSCGPSVHPSTFLPPEAADSTPPLPSLQTYEVVCWRCGYRTFINSRYAPVSYECDFCRILE